MLEVRSGTTSAQNHLSNLPVPTQDGLPGTWQLLPLGMIARLRGTVTDPLKNPNLRYIGLEHLETANPCVSKWGSPGDVRSAKTRFRAGDVLYGKLRPYLRKAALAPWDGIASTDILVLEPTDQVLPEFLTYLCHTRELVQYAMATTAGVSHPRTSWQSLRQLRVPVPPLSEQRAIVNVLSTVQRSKEATESVILAAKALKRSLMRYLFTYGAISIDAAEQISPRETPFGSVPRAWGESRLDECAIIQTGIAKGRKLARSTVRVPYIRVANVQDGYLDLTEIKQIDVEEKELTRFGLRQGDVLLTEGGDFDKLGRGFVWEGQIPVCVHQNHIFAVRCNPRRLLPKFFAFLIQSHYGKAYFLQVAHQTTHLACINSTKLRAFPVLVPEAPEQERIVRSLETADQKLTAEQQRLHALRATFDTLLFHLMHGLVRLVASDQIVRASSLQE